MKSDQALLIACRALNPFTAERLLTKDNSGITVPTAAAPDVRIDLLLHDLDEDDHTYGQHTIRSIHRDITEQCKAAGYKKVSLTSADILDANRIETIDDLGTMIASRAKK